MRSFFVLLTALFLGAAPALAQDADLQPLLDRLQRLEKDIKVLNRSVYKGEQPPAEAAGEVGGASAARMGVRITELEEQLRAMTGSVETISFKIDQVTRRLDQVMADIEFRLGSLEGGKPATGAPRVASVPKAASVTAAPVDGGAPPQMGSLGAISEKDLAAVQGSAPKTGEEEKPVETQVASQPLTQEPTATEQASVEPVKPATPQEQYNQARKLLITGDFDRAEAALKTFLADHPKDPLAANARYWLGETYYVRGDFLQAAETFLSNYQSDPKGAKAPDGLLKLGMALGNLEKKREACATFGKLLKEYPDAATNVKKVAERERKRNGC